MSSDAIEARWREPEDEARAVVYTGQLSSKGTGAR
jgi:hypothetical protein